VPESNLVGKAFRIWMNWDSAGGGIDLERIGNKIH
jgi:signal peptidase I